MARGEVNHIFPSSSAHIHVIKSLKGDHFVAGLAAGVGEWMFGHPFDTLKVRTMAAYNKDTPLFAQATSVIKSPRQIKIKRQKDVTTTMSQLRLILKNPLSKESGMLSLYRGSIPELTSAAVGNCLLFGVNNFLRKAMGVSDDEKNLTPGIVLAAGGTGLVDAVLYKPLEYIKVQMQTKAQQSFLMTYEIAHKRGGPLLFYRGLSSSILRDVIGNVGFFSTYHVMKHSLMKGGDEEAAPPSLVLLSGATAGVMYELVSFPFETAAVIMQLDHRRVAKFPSGFHCVSTVFKERGFAGLYRGIGPTLVRALPASAASFYAYEKVLQMLKDTD